MKFPRAAAPTLAGIGLCAVAGCGASDAAQPQSEDENAELTVVTSIDIYADLVTGIAGETIEVEPMVTSTAADPHSYEATPQDRLSVENADVIIANGAGYDPFITQLAAAADKEEVYQIADVGAAGEGEADRQQSDDEHSHDHSHDHAHGDAYANEHFWYDLPRMEEFVLDFAEHLSDLVPENAELYSENAAELAGQISDLHQRTRELGASGHDYLATEAVSGFLLDSAGFTNRTPPEFLAAVEHGDDVSPRLYSQALDHAEQVELLSYNAQTETQQSARIRSTAEDAGATVIEFTETLPENSSGYLEWMETNIDAVEAALEVETAAEDTR